MFDFAWSEIALIGIVALILIGPKDLPVAIRAVTDVVKKMRRMAGELQGHVDEMMRDADLQDARDTFRGLRSMNLRGQVMRAIDDDGSLRRTLNDRPLAGQDLLARPALPTPTLPNSTQAVSTQTMIPPVVPTEAPPAFVPPASGRPAGPPSAPEPVSPPPAFIPPPAARRGEPSADQTG